MSTDPLLLPPQDLEREASCLGGLLRDPARISEVSEIVTPEDFYLDRHQSIYRVLLALADAGKPLDLRTIEDELERVGQLERVGGWKAITDLFDSIAHAADTAYDASIVRALAQNRRLIEAGEAIVRKAYSRVTPPEECLEFAEREIFAIGERGLGSTLCGLPVAIVEAEARLVRRRDHQGGCGGLATGFADLDGLTDGLAPGTLTIVAARPSMGKTALALNVCEHVSIERGLPSLFVSLEMQRVEVAERIIVSRSSVDGHRVRTGRFSSDEEQRVFGAIAALATYDTIQIEHASDRTVSQIAAAARRCKRQRGLSLIVVDYLQLVNAGQDASHRASRQEQVAAISRRLKILAKELDCPVVALSQLNRQSELREDRRPRLADLRESGSIEQDADLVMLLHRPSYYDPNDAPGTAELIVAKNRNGQTATIRLAFLGAFMRFRDLDETHQF